ncbi:MAG: 50S ribosomal protein L29 [Candidatus Caldatribacteriota bacterium]|nr:50S ribosomal protein L29 [Atribacterota bacterium]MDD3031572.1 50S ribosomal protein L29 [Atribacterota bacterium]MDD3641347.1 50S ribosomal protein L29 [Atribacterota bacterium]MDD4288495.1 50S ribosomal protein L29 [Atribacterota bacterium]MDD4764328.1 50S ribosomal protein L29 [Atribacterota bacterium]
MKASELRDLSVNELEKKLSDLKDELFSLRFQSVTGQLSNFMKIREVKHEIARTKTILREIELNKKINKPESIKS